MTGQTSTSKSPARLMWILAILLAALFAKSFQPGQVLFVNDTTLGQMKTAANHLPSAFAGKWYDGTWVGTEGPSTPLSLSSLLAWIFPAEFYLKVYAPFTLFFLGVSAWIFFRQLEFQLVVCVLGGIAAALNMHFFSIACWGLGSWNIAAGFIFLALAVLVSKSGFPGWMRVSLAGCAVGINWMEGFDVGIILSAYVGAFIAWQILASEKPAGKKISGLVIAALLTSFFAVLIAAQTIFSLIGTQVKDVVWSIARTRKAARNGGLPLPNGACPSLKPRAFSFRAFLGMRCATAFPSQTKRALIGVRSAKTRAFQI